MPEHRIPRARLHEDLKSLEREHEEVVSIVADPDNADRYLVTTRYCGERIETRPA